MSTNEPPLGKFGKERLENYVFPYLDRTTRAGTGLQFGSDFNTLEVADGKVLVVSTDPLAVSPQLGWDRSSKLALQVITTDVAVSGIRPSYLLANWNLPPGTSDETFEKIWRGFTKEADRNKITIIGGHTGRYEGSSFPTIGAGTAFGLGEKEELVPNDPAPGDRVYLLNRLGLEAAVIFSFYHQDKVSGEISSSVISSIREEFDKTQPTRDLSFLASLPGVRALHDIAEGGLLGGLQEMLSGKSCGAKISADRINVDENVSRVCRFLNLDPMRITSIGSGVAAVPSNRAGEFARRSEEADIPVREIGEITDGKELSIETKEGVEILEDPVQDKFWGRLAEF
ncbi:MAG: AIR synthase-related protein [Candidatus Bipolaricaulota bacterium]